MCSVDSAFFPPSTIRSPWAQTNLPYNMLTYQQDALMKWPMRQRTHFVVTQGVLTANMADIMRAANSSLEVKMARPATDSVLKWLAENDTVQLCVHLLLCGRLNHTPVCYHLIHTSSPPPCTHYTRILRPMLNIVSVDFVDTHHFCETIVKLNTK
jgi:hypothetical protein